MADALVLATHFVEVPTAHTKIVPPIDPIAGDPELLSSIRIRSSEKEPPFPYRTRHRGYWFYVDDSDLQSKMFLEAMVATFTSRVGSKQPLDAGPQIVLPSVEGDGVRRMSIKLRRVRMSMPLVAAATTFLGAVSSVDAQEAAPPPEAPAPEEPKEISTAEFAIEAGAVEERSASASEHRSP